MTLVLGIALLLLGLVRTITARRRLVALRRALATEIMGSGIFALGFALLMLGIGTVGPIRIIAAGVVAVIGLRLLLRGVALRRSVGQLPN
jgi:hypothetical protein